MDDIFIVGVGMTPFGKFPEKSLKQLTREAVEEAVLDAGISNHELQSAWFANAAQGAIHDQHSIRGEVALRAMGIQGIPIINVENACASASTAFNQAVMSLRSGQHDVVLAVGAEKMFHVDKERSFRIFGGSWDVEEGPATLDALMQNASGIGPAAEVNVGNRSLFMDIYAAYARVHMKRFGTTQAQIAAVSAKNHTHSVHNPKAQYRTAMTTEEVLQARLISWPFTLPMCSPISDGAAAAVLCHGRALSRFSTSRAVRVRASVLGTGVDRNLDEVEKNVGRLTALKAYHEAGVDPKDVSFAEVHDATAFSEIQQIENLGFCPIGEGGPFTEQGETKLGGSIPVNPSGGLESKGHPIGATGLGQIHELVLQLRGEAGARQVPVARIGVAENGGGFYKFEEAVVGVTVLER